MFNFSKLISSLILFISFSFSHYAQEVVISSDATSSDEGSSFVMTATLDAAIASDVSVPLTITGTATSGIDFTSAYATKGVEALEYTPNTYFGDFEIHADGRFFFLNDGTLRVLNNDTDEITTINLTNAYRDEGFDLVGNIIYTTPNDRRSIYKIDISDLANVTETEHQTIPGAGTVEYTMSVEGDVILYNIYDGDADDSVKRKVYTKTGDAEPVLVYEGNACCYKPVLLNGKIYQLDSYRVDELVDGVYVLRAQFNNSWERQNVVKANGKIYAPRNNSDETIMELKFPTDGSTTGTFVPATMTGSAYDEYFFDFDSAGNIFETSYNETAGEYQLNSYQQNPEFKIAAGATTATVTFATQNDTTDEANETIIVTPGTVVNATLSDASAVTLTITDNDDPAVVTMALSSSTIVEGSSTTITLTATATPISELDITIPFTLSGTAASGEYTVSASSITIAAGSETGTVSITASEQDTDIEVMETIIFTIGSLTNGTTSVTDLTLNLESEDTPTVTSITAASDSFDEGTTNTLTMTINSASSTDVVIPLTLTGTATADTDYTSSFASLGEETLVSSITSTNNGDSWRMFRALADGRYVFLRDNRFLAVFNPTTGVNYEIELKDDSGSWEYYNYMNVSGNTIYASKSDKLVKIVISDSGTIESKTTIATPAENETIKYNPYIDGTTVYYTIYNSVTNNRTIFKKEDGVDAVEFVSGMTDNVEHIVQLNSSFYILSGSQMYDIVGGAATNQRNLSQYVGGNDQVQIFNNVLYVGSNYSEDSLTKDRAYSLDLHAAGSTTQPTFTELTYTLGASINKTSRFAINPATTDLVYYNQL
ncbi:MAG: hypothetical protein OSB25_12730, partial [Salibacteraceae bacterium]|nr:hypothetical protein [Salibacteraceae bacterium]